MSAAHADYELADRYRLEDGRVYLSGVQAVARLAVDQMRIDARNGLRTAAYVSGYQGSPVGMFFEEVERARLACPDVRVVNRRAVNEELAATAVMGSQLVTTLADATVEGVLGVWYGKAPGLDRATDAIRHAMFAGTSARGGVVAVVGDDPSAKSSTVPSSSDAAMVDLYMPLFYPGDAQECIDTSRHAVALSRAAGVWTGLKLVTHVADGTGTVDVHPRRVDPHVPGTGGAPFVPHPNGRLITPYTLDMEHELLGIRTEIARHYARANGLNRVTVSGPGDWIGIVACGYTYREMREALVALGFPRDEDLRAAGIRLVQMLMPIPFDPDLMAECVEGLEEVLVLEEKRPTLEVLVKDALYALSVRPRVWGKRTADGSVIVPSDSLLDAARMMPALRHHLSPRLAGRLAPEPPRQVRVAVPVSAKRTPFYCSGCPHNTSTHVAAGTRVGAGIGCHVMSALMEPERTGDLVGLTCMGNEGAQWIGIAPFVAGDHLVQNLGDGTYFHSGSLAVRAAVASGVNITFKLLHNGTVAMTGGQDPHGAVGVPAIASSLLAEGVKRVIITTEDTSRYAGVALPGGVEVLDRSEIGTAQEALRAIPGTTVLIHDQACAAENRRARTRGLMPQPGLRVVINERICEGCGDCGEKSGCLSVQPVDTPYGRKTAIDQTSCNFDYSCLAGDCPAFATVTVSRGDSPADRPVPPATPPLPEPVPVVDTEDFAVRMSGTGGTGIVTLSQIVGTAAMLDGFDVRGLDQTGLSQKAGPVMSDLRLSRGGAAWSNQTISTGVDCLLACDILVAASESHLAGTVAGRTVVIGSTDLVPTGEMVLHPGSVAMPRADALRGILDSASRPPDNRYLDAAALSRALFGRETYANIIVLGVAVQAGALPVEPEHLERAIVLNGVQATENLAAFAWGRWWAHDHAAARDAAGLSVAEPESLEALLARLTDDLADYRSRRYAHRFAETVRLVREAESRVRPGSDALTETAARSLHRLMAYKDEYEVARLALLPESRDLYRAVGGPRTRVTHHLHPPVLRAMGMKNKMRLRHGAQASFVVLRAMRRLRGTFLDPFGHTSLRRTERAMIGEFESALASIAASLTASNLDEAAGIAALPDTVRGYEHLKARRAAEYREALASRLARFG